MTSWFVTISTFCLMVAAIAFAIKSLLVVRIALYDMENAQAQRDAAVDNRKASEASVMEAQMRIEHCREHPEDF